MFDAASEKRFLQLKKNLDSLNYCQPLTIESAALVERLLNDLLKTTEGFQSLKKVNEELQRNAFKFEQGIEPLKRENARIIKENNDLHFQMIKIKEDAEFKENRWQNTLKSLEGDQRDLKFVLQQKDSLIKRLEEEVVTNKQKVDTIIKKFSLVDQENLSPNIVSMKSDTVKFNLSKQLKPSEVGAFAEEFKKSTADEYLKWAESLKRAEEKANKYRDEMKTLSDGRGLLEEKIKFFEVQLANRDREIERLQSKLDVSGPSVEKITSDFQTKTSQDQITRLNSQIDFLTRESTNLEEEVSKLKKELTKSNHLRSEIQALSGSVSDLKLRNEDLRKTLEEKDGAIEKLRTINQTQQDNLSEAKKRDEIEFRNQINNLKERLETVLQENLVLKETKNQASQSISAYHSDKLAFKENLDRLKQENEMLLKRLDEAKEDFKRKDNEVQILKERETQLQGRIQYLQRENEQHQNTYSRSTNDNKEHFDAMNQLRAKITELEADKLRLQNQKNDLQIEIERSARLRVHLEEQIDKIKSESVKTKSEVESGNHTQQRLQILYQSALKDADFFKREKESLESKVLDSKQTIGDLEIKCNEYFENLQVANEKTKTLERELAIMRDQITEKSHQLLTNKLKTTEVEREYADLKVANEKLAHQIEKNRKLREDLAGLEQENLRLRKQVDDYGLEVRELKAHSDKLSELNEKERNDKLIMHDQINFLMNETENVDLNLKRARERENEYNRVLQNLDDAKKTEKTLIAENEKLKGEIRKQDLLISNGTKQVEHLNHQKDELLLEIKNLRDDISLLKMNDSDVKTRSIKLQEKINNLEITIADLRDEKNRADTQVTRLEDELNAKRREINMERSTNAELTDQIKQLKTLCESLERTKDELLLRVQNKGNERKIDEEDRVKLTEKMIALQKRLEAAENEAIDSRNALIELDKERDTLQAQLDDKAEGFARLKQIYEAQEDELRQIKERTSDYLAMNDRNSVKSQELEVQLRDNSKRFKALVEENNQYKNLLALKESDIQKITNDLNILTRENQSLNQRMMAILEEKEDLRNGYQTASNQEKVVRQGLRALELERDDIMNNYKNVCIENERLKRNIDELSSDNQELFRKIKDLEREFSYHKAQAEQYEIKESQYLNEIQACERNINFLTKRLEQADAMIRDANSDKDRLIKEFEQIKQVKEGVEYSKDDLRKSLISSEQEKAYLSEQIRDLRRELDLAKSSIEYEKRKVMQIEQMLNDERKVQFNQNLRIQGLENEKVDLEMAIQHAERKNHELQQRLIREAELDSFNTRDYSREPLFADAQRTIMSLEQKLNEKDNEIRSLQDNQNSLRDENSKLKSSVFRLETERNEFEKQYKYKDSLGSTLRSSYDIDIGQDAPAREDSDERWEKLKQESEKFKRNSFDASLSSQYLKDRVKSLQKEFGEGIKDNRYKF